MINVALLGFGRIGQMHAQNIYLNKTLNLLYVYEKIDKLGKKAQNLYNCKIEKNYKKIFSDKNDIKFINRSYFFISLIFKFLGYLFNNHIIPTISKTLTNSLPRFV